MAIYRPENKYAGKMLAYMESRGESIPSVDFALDDWKIAREAFDYEIVGDSYIDRIARLWRKEYLQRPSNAPRFYSADIYKSMIEGMDYLAMIHKVRALPNSFWESVGGMPRHVMDAIEGNSIMPQRSRYVFLALVDLPRSKRRESYARLCRIMNDWEGLAKIRNVENKSLRDILES